MTTLECYLTDIQLLLFRVSKVLSPIKCVLGKRSPILCEESSYVLNECRQTKVLGSNS